MPSALRLGLWLSLIMLLYASPGWAVTITLTDGSVALGINGSIPSGPGGKYQATGPDFSMSGGLMFPSLYPPSFCSPCGAGDTVNLNANWLFGEVAGTLTFQGDTRTYTGVVGGPVTTLQLTAGSVVMPAVGGEPIVFIVPFTMTFVYDSSATSPPDPNPLVLNALGFGAARFEFAPGIFEDTGAPIWTMTSGVYTINPVPEPGTWILLATGLSLVGASRAGRRRAR